MAEERTAPLTRAELECKLEAWAAGSLSSEALCEWVEANYLPLHIEVGPGEPSHTREAMHTILSAFDHSDPAGAKPSAASSALAFLHTGADSFSENERNFLDLCFEAPR